VAILATSTDKPWVFQIVFAFKAFVAAFSDKQLDREKWPELGSGQKYVTLP